MSSPSTASLFAQNRDEVMTPILPANMNGPSAEAAVVSGRSAENNQQKPQGLEAIVAANDGPGPEDKQRLANDAIGVGQTLQDNAPGSDASYLGGQAAKMSVEVGTKALGLTTAAFTGLFDSLRDKGEDMAPDPELDRKPTPAPVQQFQPSVTSGPGGMG